MNDGKRIISLLEFSRAMDTEDNLEARKDKEKRIRYAPAIAFFDQLPSAPGRSAQFMGVVKIQLAAFGRQLKSEGSTIT